jgi:hypothetical protein
MLARKIIPSIELFDDARRQEPRALPRILLSQTQYDACAIGAAMLPLEKAYFKHIAAQNRYLDGRLPSTGKGAQCHSCAVRNSASPWSVMAGSALPSTCMA